MTDQQKKAVEESAEKIVIDDYELEFFTLGAEEVINNLEKYGLVRLKSFLIENIKKGDDTCKP